MPRQWMGSPAVDGFRLNTESQQANGLVGWWPMLGSRGANKLADFAQGRRYPGTLGSGATWKGSGPFGQALNFDGTGNAYVSVAGGHYGPTLTVAAWVNLADTSGSHAICGEFDNPGNTWLLYYRATGNFELYDGTGSYFTATVATGTWYHVVFANWPGGGITAYFNGQPQSVTGGTRTWSSTANDFAIGKWSVAPMSGQIADVRIYNRRLSAAEVWDIYAPETRWELFAPAKSRLFAVPPPPFTTLPASMTPTTPSTFQVIVPQAGINEVLNAGAEDPADANHAAVGSGVTFTRVSAGQDLGGGLTAKARDGLRTWRFQATSQQAAGRAWTLRQALPAASYVVSCWVQALSGNLPTLAIGLGTGAYPTTAITAAALATDGNGWTQLGALFTSGQASGATKAYLALPTGSTQTCDFLVDDVQVEAGTEATTWFDGDTPGCRWLGPQYASAAERPRLVGAKALTGQGRIVNLDDGYEVHAVLPWTGFGMGPLAPMEVDLASGPGKLYQGMRRRERVLTIHFAIEVKAVSGTDAKARRLLALRQALLDKCQPGQPIVLQWNGPGGVVRQIKCVLVEGMQSFDNAGTAGAQHPIPVKFIAYEPDFREVSQTAVNLATSGTLTLTNGPAVGRQSDGSWATLPVHGGGQYLRKMYVGRDQTLYGIIDYNASTKASALYKYDGTSWTQLGYVTKGGATQPAYIYDVVETMDGTALYIVGEFDDVNLAGLSAANIARYVKASGTWSVLNGLNQPGYAACASGDGLYVYVGGLFTTVNAGGTNANYIARLTISGHAWAALANGTNGAVRKILELSDGSLAVFGDFTTASTLTTVAGTTVTQVNVASGQVNGAGRRYAVTALTDEGETTVSASTWAMVTNYPTNNALRVSWTGQTGATGYRIYASAFAGADPGGSTPLKLLTEVAAGTTSYDDKTYVVDPSWDNRQDVYWPLATDGYQNTTGAATQGAALYRTTTGVWRPMGLKNGLVGASVLDAALAADGVSIAAVGTIPQADGSPCGGVAWWNGTFWSPCGSGVSGGTARAACFASDGSLHVVGDFTAAGGRTMAAKHARWLGDYRGGVWQHRQTVWPSAATLMSIVERTRDELIIAHDRMSGTATTAGVTTVTWGGSVEGYPQIVVEGPGTVRMVYNWDTGESLPFNGPALVAGRRWIVDLANWQKAVRSNWTPTRPTGVLLAGDDLWTFHVEPGINRIGVLVENATGSTLAVLVGPRSFLSTDAT